MGLQLSPAAKKAEAARVEVACADATRVARKSVHVVEEVVFATKAAHAVEAKAARVEVARVAMEAVHTAQEVAVEAEVAQVVEVEAGADIATEEAQGAHTVAVAQEVGEANRMAAENPEGVLVAPEATPDGAQDFGPHEEEQPWDQTGIESLFCTPRPPLLQQLAPCHPRQRCSFDMMTVRRSARLAKKLSIPAAERAQRNLWLKLGISNDEMAPIEEVLRDFISMFCGLLPEHIVVAMIAIFDLDDEGADMLDEALIRHAGAAVADLQEVNAMLAI